MDAGLLYLLWSLLPERVLVLPSMTCTFLPHSPSSGQDLQQLVRFGWMCSRALLVLVPIWGGGHWTLLVLQQGNFSGPALKAAQSAAWVGDRAIFGPL